MLPVAPDVVIWLVVPVTESTPEFVTPPFAYASPDENVVDAVRLFRHDSQQYQEWRPGLFDAERRDFWRTIDAHVAAFVDAVCQGRPAPVSGWDGRRALELSLAAGRSFSERRPVSV